jgi:transposase
LSSDKLKEMQSYSLDLRQRIVAAVEAGESTKEVAERFEVSWSSVKRYYKQWRETGSLEPKPRPGRPPKLTAEELEGLRQQVKEHNDATLAEHCELLLKRRGIRLGISTMWRLIAKLEISYKKKDTGSQRA